jgi:abequosyltransferase
MGGYLGDLISSILPQLNDNIEIVICDNSSDDDTSLIVESLAVNHKNISYYLNEENIGADRNYLRVVENARGEYCWLMGADDIIKEGAINTILEEIENYQEDVFLIDRDECDLEMNFRVTREWLDSGKPRTFRFNTADEFIEYFNNCKSLGSLFSYISSIIVKRESWNKADYDETFNNSYYSHVYKIFSMLLNKEDRGLRYVNKALVKTRMGNDSFAKDGIFRRYEIDIDGYKRIGVALFEDKVVRDAFWQVIVNYTPWYRLAKARFTTEDDLRWNRMSKKLVSMGFSLNLLRFVSVIGRMKPMMMILMLTWRLSVKVGLRK